ncbi:putative uncharacterized protein C3orf49 homolog [Sceloporus undulatus]|uniref:putative uncharacterized protein C3orf49 homolog n=1 Tax=Sceloporus undulatus TaxID=8520 RepID=UPI001C4D8760|nr:putative uncharacterized protein C3orf49 homolog [Sceloporus undulatus]
MQRNQRYFSLRCCRGRPFSGKTQQAAKKMAQLKERGSERQPRLMPTKQSTLMPLGQFPSGSASLEFHIGKKKSLVKLLRTTVRKIFPFHQKTSKKVMLRSDDPSEPLMPRSAAIRNKCQVLPKTIYEFSLRKVLPKQKGTKLSQNASVQLDVNIVEQRNIEAKRLTRMTRRISVVSLSPGIQKVSYLEKKKNIPLFKKKKKSMPSVWYHSNVTLENLQMQVDNLLDNISEKSVQLLALRGAELQQCESLGNKILQSSKQFQKVSLRTTKKHKLKNMCFPCKFCCLKW